MPDSVEVKMEKNINLKKSSDFNMSQSSEISQMSAENQSTQIEAQSHDHVDSLDEIEKELKSMSDNDIEVKFINFPFKISNTDCYK